MRISASWLGVALVLATLHPLHASAQGGWPGRAQDAVALTDQRLDVAETLVLDGPSSASSELSLARQFQARAHAALGAGRFGMAQRATMEARSHADRAIAASRDLPDPDRVIQHLERTSELADWAQERLAGCTQPRAQALLMIGHEIQERAEVAAHEGRFLAALQLTNNARERIQRAMSLCNVSESLEETAGRSLRKTDDLLARAKSVAERQPPDGTGPDLRHAFAMQSDARAAFEAREFERSVRMTQDARRTARRILRAPFPGGGPPPHGGAGPASPHPHGP